MNLLTKRQVAARMGCHYATIEARVRRGEFPAATVWLGPNSPRWVDLEVDRLIDLLARTRRSCGGHEAGDGRACRAPGDGGLSNGGEEDARRPWLADRAGEDRQHPSAGSSNGKQSGERMMRLAELWERTSFKGTRYFSGFMGDTQLFMFDAGERDHPSRPGERVRVWRLMVRERDPARRPRS